MSGAARAHYASRFYELAVTDGPSVFADDEYFRARQEEIRGWLGDVAPDVTAHVDAFAKAHGLADRFTGERVELEHRDPKTNDFTLVLWRRRAVPKVALDGLVMEVAHAIARRSTHGAPLIAVTPEEARGPGWRLTPVWTLWADPLHEAFVRRSHLQLWDALVAEVRRALAGLSGASGDAIVVVGHGGMNAHLRVATDDAALRSRLGALVR